MAATCSRERRGDSGRTMRWRGGLRARSTVRCRRCSGRCSRASSCAGRTGSDATAADADGEAGVGQVSPGGSRQLPGAQGEGTRSRRIAWPCCCIELQVTAVRYRTSSAEVLMSFQSSARVCAAGRRRRCRDGIGSLRCGRPQSCRCARPAAAGEDWSACFSAEAEDDERGGRRRGIAAQPFGVGGADGLRADRRRGPRISMAPYSP